MGFSLTAVMVLQLLDRKGWTLAQWNLLTKQERDIWLAYEKYRQHTINGVIDMLKEKHYNKKGDPYHHWTFEMAAQILPKLYLGS